VLQGERQMARDNRTLGRFHLIGLPPAPRGVPQIEVGFDIDANGIVNVRATDKGTGKEQKITITASSGLSKEEVERMQREAEQHAAEDARRREEIETRNAADSLAYTAERTLKDAGDKVPADLKTEVEGKIQAVRTALAGTDVQAVQRAAQELGEAMQRIGQAVYGQAGAGAAPGGPEASGPGGKDEGTVEGEFREV
ncbi:MAG: Hsp70 family protein, partial [Chloroflexi bacterium]|nr:Hsp70 family protein [Chloroflexota bacterium]